MGNQEGNRYPSRVTGLTSPFALLPYIGSEIKLYVAVETVIMPSSDNRRSKKDVVRDLRWAYDWARWYVLYYCALATFLYAAGGGARGEPLLTLPAIFLFYAVAAAVSSTIVGLLRPVGMRSKRGAMLVGILATLPVYVGGVAAALGFKALADVPGDVGVLIGSVVLGVLVGRFVYNRSHGNKRTASR